ncbi:uncharacterized protein LOC142341111 [Convolutriloba macropyga]|uniref:uncharacterized protein LOC142341111 n=1 Tax=Convolutriloba macropyga TaxID=536237 RepID=UPI003F52161D
MGFTEKILLTFLDEYLMNNKRKSTSQLGGSKSKLSKKKDVKQQSIHSFFGGGPQVNKTKTPSKISSVKSTKEAEVVSLSSDDENSCDVQACEVIGQEDNKKLEKDPNISSDKLDSKEDEKDSISYSPLLDEEVQEALSDLETIQNDQEITKEVIPKKNINGKTCSSQLISVAEKLIPAKNPKQYRISNNFAGIDNGMKKCPFYKKIPSTNFVVDAFSYGRIDGVTAYFLSHFHYDHYQGLTKHFPGKIYCNEVTAKLCQLKLRVPDSKIHILPMNSLCNVENVQVMLLDANHCPGSCMFLFIKNDFEIYLHTGDFRASSDCSELWKNLEPYRNKITKLFLDTTYLNPTYCFPPQNEIVGKVVDLVLSIAAKRGKDSVLFVFGSYTIGKERLFLKVAEVLDGTVSVDKPKFDILNCFGWPEVDKRVELRSKTAMIVVKPMNEIKVESLRLLSTKITGTRRFSHIVGFIPTGWTQNRGFDPEQDLKPTREDGNISIYSVPYSEHSSFDELKTFVHFLKPQQVVPTVGRNYKEMNGFIANWLKQ